MKRLAPCLFAIVAGPLLLAGCGSSTPAAPVIKDVSLPAPTNGFQLLTETVDIPAGQEWQACYFYKVPDLNQGQPYYVSRIEMAQNPGSHHMNIFRQGTVLPPDPKNPNIGLHGDQPDGTGKVISLDGKGPCFTSSNWADWPLVVNSQVPSVDASGSTVPYVLDLAANARHDNVAYKVTPGEILMLQSHFVNATTQKTPGHARAVANFHRLMDTTNVQEVGTLFATKQSIEVCKNAPTPTYTGYCKIPSQVTIIAANGHFHSRGTDFTIQTYDGKTLDPALGTRFYESKTWDEPPMATGLNVAPPMGGGVSFSCSYQWAPSPACADGCSCIKEPAGKTAADCCYGFGGVVEISEHCNAFVYYYPALPQASSISCM